MGLEMVKLGKFEISFALSRFERIELTFFYVRLFLCFLSRSYVQSWLSLLKTHELLADNRLRFSSQLQDMSEELLILSKEVEKNRKVSKDLGTRLERGLVEQDNIVDKSRVKFDFAVEELEKLLFIKSGENKESNGGGVYASSINSNGSSSTNNNQSNSINSNNNSSLSSNSNSNPNSSSSSSNNKRTFGKAISKLKGPKTVAQVAKQEEECRIRMGQCSDAYRSQVAGAETVRKEYFNSQLPKILRVSF